MSKCRYMIWLSIAAAILIAVSIAGAWALMNHDAGIITWLMFAAAMPFVAVAWFAIRYEQALDALTIRRATWIILAAAAAMRVALLPWPPASSTDIYRYVWDGRVQAAGINPYRYAPADPALASLRDKDVYPNINRATYAPTIYPPAAQIMFRAVATVYGGVTAMKLAIVGFEGLIVATLLALLGQRRLPSTRVLLYAWHPLPLFEFSGSGHLDAIAIAFMLLACVAVDRRRLSLSGGLLAIATLVKFFPLVIAPALYRRWDWRAPVVAVFVAVALYLPFLSVGGRVFGYLPGYASEESLISGDGFLLLSLIDAQTDLPSWAVPAYLVMGLAILGAGAVWAIRRPNPAETGAAPALFLLGVFTVFLSPHLPWYFTWLVPFLCIRPAWSFIYLTCAAPLLYYQVKSPENPIYSLLIYVPFLIILAVELLIRLWETHADVSYVRP